MEKDWIIRIYDTNDNIMDHWIIQNRTESQAFKEASNEVKEYESMNDYDTWTMTPWNVNEKVSIGAIVESYHNGQLKQMVDFIDSYELDDIWLDLRNSIVDKYGPDQTDESFHTYSEMVIAYHRIKSKSTI